MAAHEVTATLKVRGSEGVVMLFEQCIADHGICYIKDD